MPQATLARGLMHNMKGAVMLRKRLLMALAIGLGALALAGCSSPDIGTPAGVVEVFFNRLDDEDQAGVRALMCEDYRQNVNLDIGEGREVDYDFDLRFDAGDDDNATAVDVAVYGKIEMHLRSDDIRYEVQERRTSNAPWTVRVASIGGEWQVCGADEQVLAVLDARSAFEALE